MYFCIENNPIIILLQIEMMSVLDSFFEKKRKEKSAAITPTVLHYPFLQQIKHKIEQNKTKMKY